MDFVFFLFEISLLAFPIIGIVISELGNSGDYRRIIKILVIFFLLHNALFSIGYSVRGDYLDYIVFSLEYLLLCLVTTSIRKLGVSIQLRRAIGFLGVTIQIIGIVIGSFGFFFLMIVSGDYESDGQFRFVHNNGDFEVRRYSSGFVTQLNPDYRFDAYREFKFLPFEYKICEIDLTDTETNLPLRDTLLFSIEERGQKKLLIIKSLDGAEFARQLK